ncbi:uncharacterized protein BP5553_00579 [Venustampulla echinocandica]|uniref:Uncharacterized protein n=1 Tax=Venustampulla echinocandica TaxID=2656787 RepID=A0A370TYL0_9HELO|nr:uncharacterized protein BP5553_00579 [Venustampulla echinocandica]RDL40600.1 hypothetical protein BP5553_00579 [Venustampulla echinocandica]
MCKYEHRLSACNHNYDVTVVHECLPVKVELCEPCKLKISEVGDKVMEKFEDGIAEDIGGD